MFIVLRIFAVVIGIFLRRLTRDSAPSGSQVNVNGTPAQIEVVQRKRGNAFTKIGFVLDSPIIFKLTEESIVDGLLKVAGLAEELQTGDGHFDKLIFVAADDPGFCRQLKDDETLRGLAVDLVTRQGSISCQGHHLIFTFKGDRSGDRSLLEKAQAFHALLLKLDRRRARALDGNTKTLFFTEAFIWGVAGYALSGVLEFSDRDQDLFLYPMDLLRPGVLAGVALFGVIFLLLYQGLHRSSRGGRLLIESALVLSLSLPIAGVTLVADLNRIFDRRDPYLVLRKIKEAKEVVRHGRRRTTIHYYVLLEGPTQREPVRVPHEIEVSPRQYRAAQTGTTVRLEIGRGRFKIPYYQRLIFY